MLNVGPRSFLMHEIKHSTSSVVGALGCSGPLSSSLHFLLASWPSMFAIRATNVCRENPLILLTGLENIQDSYKSVYTLPILF